MEIAIEALRNGDIGLNAASLPSPFRKYTRRDKLFCCEIIELIDEEELVILIAVGTVRVLYNDHLFLQHIF